MSAVDEAVFFLVTRQELMKELNGANGNGSLPVVSSSQAADRAVEVESGAEEPAKQQAAESDAGNGAGPQEKVAKPGCGLSSVRRASRRAASLFTVENPHNIDSHSRTAFPMAFLVVNIFYWLYYLFL